MEEGVGRVMRIEDDRYMALLRFCMSRTEVPNEIADVNWHELLQFTKEQAITGIYAPMLLEENARLEDCGWMNNRPTDDDIMEWMRTTKNLEKKNKAVNDKAAWVATNFDKEGFHHCLLKGQGNAQMYPNPLWRSSGDIDIWVWPKGGGQETESMGQDVSTVIAYCRKIAGQKKACYHHIDFRPAGNIPVEVHYRPSWLNNPFNNRRLQAWFLRHREQCCSNMTELGFNVPTWEFNAVFQLCHIYNHLIHEGIGLRQFCDYYYLLKRPKRAKRKEDTNETERHNDLTTTLRRLGLMPIASATMWVLQTVMGLEKEHLVCTPDKRRGRVLMKEIIAGGNFGHFDKRPLSGSYASPLMSNLQRLARDLRLLRFFPSECLWEPWFRLYHWAWRKRHQ